MTSNTVHTTEKELVRKKSPSPKNKPGTRAPKNNAKKASRDKAKYTQQRKNDESIVNKSRDSGRRGKQSDKADSELQQIGAKVFSANNPPRKKK